MLLRARIAMQRSRRLACATSLAVLFVPAGHAAAGGWTLPPAPLAPATAGAGSPAVALDGRGDAVVAWVSGASGSQSLLARRRPAGGDWSAPLPVASAAAIASPSVALDAAGAATVAWTSSDDLTSYAAHAAQLPAGSTTWSAAHDFPALDEPQPLVQVGVDGAGDAVAAWLELDATSSTYLVRAATRSGGGAWSAPVTVSDPGHDSAESFGTPQVGIDAAGDAVVAWTAQDLSDFSSHVQAATFAGGGWSGPHDVFSTPDVVSPVLLADDAAGGAVAVWRKDDPYTIQAGVLSSGGWDVQDLSTDVAPTCTPQLAVGADAAGHAAVAWNDAALHGVSARQHASGGWGPAAHVFTPASADVSVQGIGLAGGATAAWSTLDVGSGATAVQGAHFSGGGWEAPTPLASTTDGSGFSTPALAADDAGDALATWAQTDPLGDAAAISAASFAAPAPMSPPRPPTPPPVGTPPPAPLPAAHALGAPLLSIRGGALRLRRGARTLALTLTNRDAVALRGSARLVYATGRGARTIALQARAFVRARARTTLHLTLSVLALRRLRSVKGHAYLVQLSLRLRAPDGRLARASATYVLGADFGARGLPPRVTLRAPSPRPRARLAC